MRKPKGISKYLRARRIEAGQTQMEAAKALGHQTAQYISNLERGLCEPSIEMAFNLNDIYGGSPKELEAFMISAFTEQLRARIKTARKKL